MSQKMKPKRACFTDSNCHTLVDIILLYTDIVECKKSDVVTWKEKDAAWAKIAETYNSATTEPRTSDQLRYKYENLKKEVRKYSYEALKRQNLYKTSGGIEQIVIKETIKLLCAKIKSIITLSVQGLDPCEGDSDQIMRKKSGERDVDSNSHHIEIFDEVTPCISISTDATVIPDASPAETEDKQHVENGRSCDAAQAVTIREAKKDWSDYTPNMLKSKKHKVLQRKRKISDRNTNYLDLKNDQILLKNKLLEEEAIRNEEYHIQRIRRENDLHALKIINLELENHKLELENQKLGLEIELLRKKVAEN